MNTPAHAVLNLLVLARGRRRGQWLPVLLGSLIPDLPLIAFYAVQRGLLRVPERIIWSQRYFEPDWQSFFDAFNSLPLMAVGALLAAHRRAPRALALFLSAGLHCVADLLVHREDAHRHFLPLSDWRFRSPVSYWDPRHGGEIFALVELALVVGGCWLLLRGGQPAALRATAAVLLAIYAAYALFAVLCWTV